MIINHLKRLLTEIVRKIKLILKLLIAIEFKHALHSSADIVQSERNYKVDFSARGFIYDF